MSHIRTLEIIISQVRIPFRPKHNPSQKLTEEIESCKRKIWDCIGPAERKRYMEKKQKKYTNNDCSNDVHTHKNSHQLSKRYPPVAFKENCGQQQLSEIEEKAKKNRDRLPKQPTQTRSDIELKVFVMKVVELKKTLRDQGCDTSGLKKDLRARLISVMLEQLNHEELSVPSIPSKPTGIFNTKATTKSIMEEKREIHTNKTKSFNSSNTSENNEDGNLGDETIPLSHPNDGHIQKLQRENKSKESFSSMQVEHRRTQTEPVQELESDQKEQQQRIEQKDDEKRELMKSSSGHAQEASTVNNHKHSKGQKKLVGTITEEKESSFREIAMSNEPQVCLNNNQDEMMNNNVALLNHENKESNKFSEIKKKVSIDDDDASPQSEVSCSSKTSGNSVKDMVSKFSGFSSLSSTGSGGSALSKGLQAKKEARQAKIAEMRAKSKPVTSSKIALKSKEYSTTLSSLNAASKGTNSTKKNLTTQMREKAAALAYKSKLTPSVSKTGTTKTLGSENKRNLPFSNSSNNFNIAAAQDSLGTTLKQGTVYDTLGTTLKQGSVYDSLGTTLKHGSSFKESKVMSPMDTYDISDRENSDTDDSDSDSENETQKKKVPKWALRANLYPALEDQYNGRIGSRRVDPDDIFPEVQSCDLEAIFGTKKAKVYRSRASSGNWAKDKVTTAEKLVYKRQMGFATDSTIPER